MLRPGYSDFLSIILPSIIEHFKFLPNLLNLLLVAVRLEDVHGSFEIRSGISDLHRDVDSPKQFQSARSLQRILPKHLLLELDNLKKFVDCLFKPLTFQQKGGYFPPGLNHSFIFG